VYKAVSEAVQCRNR